MNEADERARDAKQFENNATVLITLGRIEERLNAMKENEKRDSDRLAKVEQGLTDLKTEVTSLKSSIRPKSPWYVVLGAVVGVVTVAVLLFNQIIETFGGVPPTP